VNHVDAGQELEQLHAIWLIVPVPNVAALILPGLASRTRSRAMTKGFDVDARLMASGCYCKLHSNRDTPHTPPKIPAGMEAVCDDGRASNRELLQRI
jgi:hypothetical protein